MSDDLPKEDKAMSQHTVTAPATAKRVPPYMVTMQATKSGEASVRIRMTLDRLDRYTAMTKLQNERIWEAQRRSQALTMGETPTHESLAESMLWLERSWVEAHFYFIGWDCVAKLIDTLCDSRNHLEAPRNIRKRHRATLESYREARDHLEHWTERLPGGKRDQWQKSSSQGYTTMTGDMGLVRLEGIFTFRDAKGHDKELDISPASAELLERICKELREELTIELGEMAVIILPRRLGKY
jgi:hypothetical protein